MSTFLFVFTNLPLSLSLYFALSHSLSLSLAVHHLGTEIECNNVTLMKDHLKINTR